MPGPPVATVMTRTVFTAFLDTPFAELVTTLTDHRCGAVPVIDTTGRPLGVVSDRDMLAKLEYQCGADHPPLLAGRRTRAHARKATACTAGDLMTSPAPTVPTDMPVSVAAHVLADPSPGVLCVTDRIGRLVGLLTRTDLLRVYRRGDHALETDIDAQLTAAVGDHHQISVQVTHGTVTLTGTLTLRSIAEHAHRIARCVPGVITTRNDLTYRVDDLSVTGF